MHGNQGTAQCMAPGFPIPSHFIGTASPIACWLASQITRYRLSWRVSQSPRHRRVRCIMTSLATTVGSLENAPNIKFSYASFWVWNDGNSRNQTLTIGRLFQPCMSNYSQQEKLEHSEYICVTFTMLLLWVNLWYFGTWFRVAARAGCDKQCKYKYKVIAILPISEQNVFSLCAKWLVCSLFDISTIDQPLFRGWGPPLREAELSSG